MFIVASAIVVVVAVKVRSPVHPGHYFLSTHFLRRAARHELSEGFLSASHDARRAEPDGSTIEERVTNQDRKASSSSSEPSELGRFQHD